MGSRPLSFSRGMVELEAVVRPLVEADGLELVDIGFAREGGRRVLRVTVDREGGVDLDAIAEASERLSRRLDALDAVQGPYSLEVSSPGVERPLRAPREFRRHVGWKVKVRTAEPIDGARNLTGRLSDADDDGVTLLTDRGVVRVPYGQIASARTIFEWGRGDK